MNWNDLIEKSAYDSVVADYGTCSAERDTLKAENERLKESIETLSGAEDALMLAISQRDSLHLEAVKLAEALKYANMYIDYSMEFDDTTKMQDGLEKVKPALSSFHTFLKKEKGES